MEILLGMAMGWTTALLGAAMGKVTTARKKEKQTRPTQCREEEPAAANALEEQWNNLMRFNGTAQRQ